MARLPYVLRFELTPFLTSELEDLRMYWAVLTQSRAVGICDMGLTRGSPTSLLPTHHDMV